MGWFTITNRSSLASNRMYEEPACGVGGLYPASVFSQHGAAARHAALRGFERLRLSRQPVRVPPNSSRSRGQVQTSPAVAGSMRKVAALRLNLLATRSTILVARSRSRITDRPLLALTRSTNPKGRFRQLRVQAASRRIQQKRRSRLSLSPTGRPPSVLEPFPPTTKRLGLKPAMFLATL